MIPAIAFVLAAGIAFFLTPPVRALALRVGAIDAPGERKVHTQATARLGGLAVLAAGAGSLAATAVLNRWLRWTPGAFFHPATAALTTGALLIFIVGVRDDIRGVAAAKKMTIIGLAAVVAMAAGVVIDRVTFLGQSYELGLLAWPGTFMWIIVVTNAFNMIDGLDGLATGLAIVAAASCAAVLLVRGDHQNAIVLVALVGAAVGFLPYNFNPATIFLGDCGSLVFGYVLAVTAITGWQKGATALAIAAPLLVMALPIADLLGSVVRRLAAHHSIFAADQQHIHHWLLRHGVSHRAAVLILYACAVFLAALAVFTGDYR